MSGVGYTQSLEPQSRTHNLTGKKEDEKKEVLIPLSYHPGETMMRHFNCGVWIFLSLLFYESSGFISNASAQNLLLNVTVFEDEENADWKSAFLQLRANLPSFSQPLRPYTLLTNAEDYHYMPKPRHRRPSRLLRLLGSSFDPFWMSTEKPSDASEGNSTGKPLLLPGDTQLKEAEESHRLMLEKEAADLDLGPLPSHVASLVRNWLVRTATCRLSYQWVDLGPAFWPRWLRQTDCERSDEERSCSFPGGMECVRAQTADIKILAWHCLDIVERGIKGDRAEIGTGEVMKRCAWRRVSYPVVTACSCSCK